MDVVAGLSAFKVAVAQDYDLAAEACAETVEVVLGVVVAPLAEVLRGVRGRVLDACSGTGNLGRLLDDVVALDLSEGQLRHNVVPRRVRADVERLPFRSDAFAAAGCAFGLNHCPDPQTAVAELARVAPLVALLTWERPAPRHLPKDVVAQVVERHTGRGPAPARLQVDRLGERVGSADAVEELLVGAGLVPDVRVVVAEVPWPGAPAYVRSRLALAAPQLVGADVAAITAEAEEAVRRLPDDALRYRPRLVLGLGRRSAPAAEPAGGRRGGPPPRAPRPAAPPG